MRREFLITGAQLVASLTRILTFAYAVLAIGRTHTDSGILMVIGYLPYLAFFDILIQSGSRASHLYAPHFIQRVWAARTTYARIAITLIGAGLWLAFTHPAAQVALLLGAWPLGALGYLWEGWIANRTRQTALAVLEIAILITAAGLFATGLVGHIILLVCIISAPAVRLAVMAVNIGGHSAAPAALASHSSYSGHKRSLALYIGASLGQQLLGATAATLPAIFAQVSGNTTHLAMQLVLFRTLQSASTVASFAVNAISSRIFYNQVDGGIARMERGMLKRGKQVIPLLLAMVGIAGLVIWQFPAWFAGVAVSLFPIMTVVNVSSSLLYNRGLPLMTLNCQAMILMLSLAFLLVLNHAAVAALVVLLIFAVYLALTSSPMLRAYQHRIS